MKKLLSFIFLMFFQNMLWAALPAWISNIGPCSISDICVVGSSDSLKGATINGRSELAKFFETRVIVNSTYTTQSSQESIDLFQSKYNEWSNREILEMSDEIINGVEIKQSEKIDETYYVLLSLSKAKMAQKFKTKIKELDELNEALLKKGNRFVFPQIILNLKKRDFLFARFNLVSNEEIKSSFNLSKLSELIQSMNVLNISLISERQKLPPSYKKMIEEILGPLKIVIVNNKVQTKYKIKSSLLLEPMYFKVEGFKKINVIFKLELYEGANIIGRVSSSSIQIARSDESAIEASKAEIENEIKEKLDQLVSGHKE